VRDWLKANSPVQFSVHVSGSDQYGTGSLPRVAPNFSALSVSNGLHARKGKYLQMLARRRPCLCAAHVKMLQDRQSTGVAGQRLKNRGLIFRGFRADREAIDKAECFKSQGKGNINWFPDRL